MTTDKQHRCDEVYARMCRHVVDEWTAPIVRQLGASHAVVLTVIARLTVGRGRRSAQISPRSDIAPKAGISPQRAYPVLRDLERLAVIAMSEPRRGQTPTITINLDWTPDHEVSTVRDTSDAEMSTARDNRLSPARDTSDAGDVHSTGHLEPEMSTPRDNSPVSPKVPSLESTEDLPSLDGHRDAPTDHEQQVSSDLRFPSGGTVAPPGASGSRDDDGRFREHHQVDRSVDLVSPPREGDTYSPEQNGGAPTDRRDAPNGYQNLEPDVTKGGGEGAGLDDPGDGELSTRDYNPVVHQSEQLELSTAVNNQLFATVNNEREIERKALRGENLPKGDSDFSADTDSVWEKKQRTPTPQTSSSGKGKETRPTDEDYEEQVKRKAELVALGEDAPREPKGSEEEFDGWRDLEAKAKTIPPDGCDWFSELFAEKFAPRLKLENKVVKLQQVHEWVVRQNRDAFKPVWLAAWRCKAEQEKGKVRYPWPHFMAAVVEEWNDNIRFLPPPHTDEVLCARVEAEETAHALGVLRNLPGWPRNSEKEVSDLVVRCLWHEEYLFKDMLAAYEEYVQRIGGLGNARIESEPAGALEHLRWYAARYWESLDDKEFTLEGRVEPREVLSNTV